MADIFECAALDDAAKLEDILSSGTNPNDRDDFGKTGLHICATYGHESCAKVLLRFGADHSLQDFESGWTALHRSLYFGHLNMSLLLIRAGAEVGDEFVSDWKIDVGTKREPFRSIKDCKTWRSPIDHDGHSPLDLLSLRLSVYLNTTATKMSCTDLLAFGKADFPLGIALPNASDVLRPRRVDRLTSCQIVEVATSKSHTAAVTRSGELYTWGHGKGGRLGHGDESTLPEPAIVSFFVGRKVRSIALAENHSVCITDAGDIWCWGSNRYGQLGQGSRTAAISVNPVRVDSLRKFSVVSVAAGSTHTVCVCNQGEVFAWGSNKHGQLGLKATRLVALEAGGPGSPFPQIVDSLPKIGSKSFSKACSFQVSAAAYSTLFLCPSTSKFADGSHRMVPNEVFQWGYGSSAPSRIDFNSTNLIKRRSSSCEVLDEGEFRFSAKDTVVNIVQVSAGLTHNIAISCAAHVYTWGLGSDQLGHGPLSNKLSSPQLLETLLPENGGGRVVHASAASSHSCVVTDTGDIYTWGAPPDKVRLRN